MSHTAETFDRAVLADLRTYLKGPAPLPVLQAMLFDYAVLSAVIVGMLQLAGSAWFVALLPLAWLVIAARQHALLVLMHEATHSLAHRNRFLNELWGELLLGAPMLVSMRKYRRDHLRHHRHANTAADPDWVRKLGTESEARYWQFPVAGNGLGFLLRSWARSILYLLRSFTHLSGVSSKTGTIAEPVNPPAQAKPPERINRIIGMARIGLYASAALLATLFGGWWAFLLLWLAPLLLVLPIITRLRSIAEHFALSYRDELTNTRTILAGPLERFVFAPHGINYHLEHHLLASVSFSRLPELHRRLMQTPAYAAGAHLNDGYLLGPRSLRRDMVRLSEHRTESPADLAPPAAVPQSALSGRSAGAI